MHPRPSWFVRLTSTNAADRRKPVFFLAQETTRNSHGWANALIVFAMIAAVVFPIAPANATQYTCDETGLDAAIAAGGGPHTFDCAGPTTITTSGTKTVSTDLTLDGEGLLTVSGSSTHQVFQVISGASFEVRNMTISGGGTTASTQGGAIGTAGGSVTVSNSSLSSNSANDGGAIALTVPGDSGTVSGSVIVGNNAVDLGGGVAVFAGTSMTVTGSTIAGNSNVGAGGGFAVGGSLTVINSTISGNVGEVGGGIATSDPVTIINTTITGNHGAWKGGGLNTNTAGPIVITASIIAGNTAASGEPDCRQVSTPATSGGHNVVGNDSGCGWVAGSGDIVGSAASPIDPLLGSLAHNGGPTQTHALLAGSPAIDLIPVGSCAESVDQRGFARPQGGGCDAGAFEAEPIIVPIIRAMPQGNLIWGHDFTPGPMTVEITGAPVVYGVEVDLDGDFNLSLNDRPGEEYDLQPLHIVTATDVAASAKSLEVSDFRIDHIDADDDLVTGWAQPTHPNIGVWIDSDDSFWLGRGAGLDFNDTTGDWTADFGAIGYNIVPGMGISASDCDAEDDCTNLFEWLPDPRLSVNPDQDHITGSDWPANEVATITVNSTHTFTTDTSPDGYFGHVVGYDILPGDRVELTVGPVTKDHVVNEQYVMSADIDIDSVTGIGPANATISVGPADWWEPPLDVVVGDDFSDGVLGDGLGQWVADYAGQYDIAPGTTMFVLSNEYAPEIDDGDTTWIEWTVPNTRFWVHPGHDQIFGEDWEPNTDVIVSVYQSDLATLKGSALVTADGGGFFEVFLQDEPSPFGVDADDYVVVNQGGNARDHVVIDLTADVDVDTDAVFGTTNLFNVPDFHDIDAWITDGPVSTATPDAGNGDWGVNFWDDHGVDIQPGDWGRVDQPDDDGDRTQADWYAPTMPNYVVNADAGSNTIWGHQWSPGELEIVIAGGPPWTVPVSDGSDELEAGDFNMPVGWLLNPGDEIVVTHTSAPESKTLIISELSAYYEPASGTVDGVAAPDSFFDVWVHDTDPWVSRNHQADGVGSWSVDFAVPGDVSPEEDATIVLGPGNNGAAALCDDDGDCTFAHWEVPQPPSFSVESPFDVWSTSEGWVEGNTATLTIDDGSGGPAEHTQTVVVERWGPEPWEVGFGFGTAPFEMHPGFEITVDDGVTAKTLVLDPLTIDLVDEGAATVSGTAPPDTPLQVDAGDEHGGCGFEIVSESDGSYVADFSGDPCYMGFGPGIGGSVQVFDDDGDSTHRGWYIEEPSNPHFNVDPGGNHIWGHEWSPGELEIAVDGGPTWIVPVGDGSGEMGPGDFDFNLNEASPEWTLNPGDHLSVSHTSAPETKDQIVSGITVDEVDVDDDTVEGSADPDSELFAFVHDTDPQVWRTDQADNTGYWLVDFSVPGDLTPDEDEVADLEPGTPGEAGQCDADGDCTYVFWQAPNPTITAETLFDVWSSGDGWDEGAIGELNIYDEVGTPVLSDGILVERWGPEPWEVGFNYHAEPVEFHPGYQITLDMPGIHRVLDVVDLTIDAVDEQNEIVSGHAPPDTPVHVNAGNDDGDCGLEIMSDDGGYWEVDFSADPCFIDLEPGWGGSAQVFDDDGDSTHRGWQVEAPSQANFNVDVANNNIWGHQWSPGELEIEIVGGHSWTVPVSDGSDEMEFGDFNLNLHEAVPGWTLSPGDEIMVTHLTEPEAKDHIVTDLVAGYQPATGTVDGVAAPDSFFDVWVHDTDPEVWRNDQADGAGDWSVDFSTPGDLPEEGETIVLEPGNNGAAAQCDDDGDCTFSHWRVMNPYFVGVLSDEVIDGWDWTPDDFVHITINATDVDATVATDGEGSFKLELMNYDLAPGDEVVVEDLANGQSKSHTMLDLVIVEIDAEADTISGVTDLFDVPWEHNVYSWFHDDGGWFEATPDAGDGSWLIDYAPADLGPGSSGGIGQLDDDGDGSEVNWWIPFPVIRVHAEDNSVWGHDFAPGPLTVDITGAPVIYVVDVDPEGNFDIDLDDQAPGEEHDLVAGDVVVATDSDLASKSIEVSPHEIHAIDADNDVVTGWAPPDHPNVSVWLDDGSEFWLGRGQGLDFNDITGEWLADFGAIGGDIGPGTHVDSADCDPEDDCSHASGRVLSPEFQVNPVYNNVDGQDWLSNDTVTVTFNGTEVFDADTDGEGNFGIGVDYDIVPGDLVEVTDGNTTKTHTVYELRRTDVDLAADTVTGHGPADVTLHVGFEGWDGELEVAVGNDDSDGVPGDGLGLWIADFSGELDIVDESFGHIRGDEYPEAIDDGDSTWINWWVANPRLQVNITENQVRGGDWPEGAAVSLSVAGKPGCDDTQIADVSTGRWQMNVEFDMSGCTVVPGDMVTLSDGVTIETHEVRDFQVTDFDVALDTVDGTNNIGSRVFVIVWGDDTQDLAFRDNINDLAGPWMADFSVPPASGDDGFGVFDIVAGTSGLAGASEPNANETVVDWQVPLSSFSVEVPLSVWSTGEGWVEGNTATLAIDDGSGGAPEHTDTALIERWGPEPWEVGFSFDTAPFDILPGYEVSVDDGVTFKTLVVEDVVIDSVDEATELVSGAAPPDTLVQVDAGNDVDGCGFEVTSNGSGNWEADFSAPPCALDLAAGWNVSAQVFDDDGDSSHAGYSIEEPPVDFIDFSTLVVESYEFGQDDGIAEVLDDGATLRLFGNAWKRVYLPTVIEPDTILEFDFSSSSQGEIHGIGFDTNNGMSPDLTFQLYGTQNWGIQDYRTYVAPGVMHYEIPVGLFYTGDFDYLVFLTDDDANGAAESVFSNITIGVPTACTISWNVDADGSWGDPTNWSPQRVPDASDDVCIDRPGADVWVWLNDPFEANTLWSTEAITLPTYGSSLSLHGPSVLDGFFGGVGNVIADDLTLNAETQWLDGAWVGSFVNNGTFDFRGTGEGILQGTFVNEAGATFLHSGIGWLNLGLGTEVTNRGLWDFTAQGDLLSSSGGSFINDGVIHKTGVGTTIIDPGFVDTPGTVEVDSGLLRIDSPVAQVIGGTLVNGSWAVSGTGALELNGHGPIIGNDTDVTLDGELATFSGFVPGVNSGMLELLNAAVLVVPTDFTNVGDLRLGTASTLGVPGAFSNTGTVVVEIADEPISGLFGGIVVAGEATLGGTLDIDLVGGFTPAVGEEFELMHWVSHVGAFGHIIDLAPHFTPDYRTDAFVLMVEEPPVIDSIDFSTLTVESYEFGQDFGTAEVLDGGATLRLTGNAWKRVMLATEIVPETILEFDFMSSSEGEIHGIGFDTNNGMSPDQTFQLYGTQTWGIQDYATYVAPGVTHYEIPVGLFYTGEFDYLVFLNDDDGDASGESVFSNVVITTGTPPPPPPPGSVDFSTLVVESYEFGQDFGTAEVLDDGVTLRLFGNAWKKVELPTEIVSGTVLEFDFSSSSQGEIHGIGFDTNNGMSPDLTFQLFGTQTWGLQDYATYVAPGVMHYEIPVGDFYTGEFDYLVFLTDDDANASAESVFSNITIS